MIKAQIIDIRDNRYMVEDQNKHIFIIGMQFKNVEYKPRLGDYIFISELVYNDPEEHITPKIYGPFTTLGYARKPEDMTERDFMVLVNDKGISVYQRYYG